MAVSKRTRFEVLKRDNHTCRYCHAVDTPLTVDHVTPVSLGGSDDPGNLVAACRDCNYGKASSSPGAPLVEDVKQADLKWADAMRRAGELRATEREAEVAYVGAFQDLWPGYRYLPDNFGDSLVALYRGGFPVEDMPDAVGIALTNRGVDDRFRYFCGVAWRKVGKLQEVAKALLEADEVEGK